MWKNQNQKALEKNGQNTSQFLALQIKKEDIPRGGSVVIMVRDDKTGEMHPIYADNMKSAADFAQNSRFYQKIMEDGHVFNPYIHRRFIASQFKQLVRMYGQYGIKDQFARSRDWDYAMGVLRKEVHTLANLERKDKEAFYERSQFFTLNVCIAILYEYSRAVNQYIDETRRGAGRNNYVYLIDSGRIKVENLRPMAHRFDVLTVDASKCKTYEQLDRLLSAFDWQKLPHKYPLQYSFVTPFLESGAYYTLKHHMMFEGLKMQRCKTSQESLRELRRYQRPYMSLYFALM